MIWDTITGVGIEIAYNFKSGVWRAQRSLIKVKTASAKQKVTISFDRVGLISPFVFSAETNNTGDYLLDVTDYMSTRAIGTTGSIEITTGAGITSQVILVDYHVNGNIAPNQLIIPNNGIVSDYSPIFAPSYYLKGLWGIYTQFPFWSIGGPFYVWQCGSVCSSEYIGSEFGTITLENEGTIEAKNDEFSHKVIVRDLECNKNYCLVQWVDSMGLIKRHTFELVNVERSIADSIELENNYGGFTTVKGARKMARLRLPKLTPYDYWYYSDIVTSSDVRVAIIEEDAEFGEDTRVKVVTQNIVTPTRIEIKDFEIDVILKDYAIV